jgi:catalase
MELHPTDCRRFRIVGSPPQIFRDETRRCPDQSDELGSPRMSNNTHVPKEAASRYSLSALSAPTALTRLGVIGLVLLGTASAFAWTAGWFSPSRLDRGRLIDALEAVKGAHPGFRRNHPKGVCLVGWFDGNGAGARLSRAAVFRPGQTPVFGRFSTLGSTPTTPDSPHVGRSMALSFSLPDGEVWRTSMNSIPVFPVKDARDFYDYLVALKPDPATGKPDPVRLAAFLSAHPRSARALALIKAMPSSSGFANETYNSLNAFRLVDANGKATMVRWSMQPVDPFEPQPAEVPRQANYLFDGLEARLQEAPAQWHLILLISQPDDPTNDATQPWPADRERIDAGTLTVTAIESEAEGNCRDVEFDPLVLPSGIEPSDDPLLSTRSAAYAASFNRRAREGKTPSAVQIGESPAP